MGGVLECSACSETARIAYNRERERVNIELHKHIHTRHFKHIQ